ESLRGSLSRALNHFLFLRKSALRELIESRGFSETATAVLSLSAKCQELEKRAATALRERVNSSGSRLQIAKLRLEATDFRALIAIKSVRLDALEQRINRALQRRLETNRRNLDVTMGKLHMLSPLSVLGRGYVLVKDEAGGLVSRASSVQSGQKLKLRFEDG